MPAPRPLHLLLAWLALMLSASAAAQTRVVNSAILRFQAPDGTMGEVASQTLVLAFQAERRASRIEWRAVPPSSVAAPVAAPCGAGEAVLLAPDEAGLAALAPAASIDNTLGATMALVAPASNRDPARRETAAVTLLAGDRSLAATLTETAPDSGVFDGVVPATGCDGWRLPRGDTLVARFAGDDASLPADAAGPVDPAGFVYDAATGAAVDGAEVTLVTDDGAPVQLWGDDGTSRYPASVTSGAAVRDESGRAYPAVAGRYRFPMVAPGRYRLRVVPPPGYAGATATPAVRDDGEGRPYRLDGSSVGEAVTLTERQPFAADIALLPADDAPLVLTRSASQAVASIGDVVQLRLTVASRGKAASGPMMLTDRLPFGLRPRPARGSRIADDGRAVSFALPSLAGGASVEVGYLVTVSPAGTPGQAVARATLERAGRPAASAALAIRLRRPAIADAVTIVGRVAEGGCASPAAARRGVAGVRLLLDDGSVALTDADGLYHLEGARAGRHVVALDPAAIPPGLVPTDCAADVRSAGSATSRFVEGAGGTLLRADFALRRTGAAAPPRDATPAVADDAAAAAGSRDWLAGRRPGVEWLFPAADYNPRAPVTRVAIQHLPGQRVALSIDGQPVDPLSFETTDADAAGVAVSRWNGIPLAPGANRLTARVLAADGGVAATLERIVRVSGPPQRATLDTAHSRLAADGLSRPLIAVRVVDADGRPVRAGTAVAVTVAAPHRLWVDPALAARRAASDTASVQVSGDDGLAVIPLQPTGHAGAVRATVSLDGGDAVRAAAVEAWLTPAAANWTLVGFGAGTVGWRTLSRHLDRRARAADRIADRLAGKGQLSFYARGRIRGEWLLTIAYDSGRRRDPDRPLLGAINPDRYYTVYGDGAVRGHDAPSRAPLFVRLERGAAQLLFGDFDTGFVDTRLARYSRTLTGFRAGWRGRGWRAEGFAARADSGAVRDEMPGIGLAGPYRLRASPLPGSERLRVEARDRVRPELVVATTPLVRTIDYEVDEGGTVRLRVPLLSRDANGNPQWLVAEYEADRGEGRVVAGGRVATTLANGRVALGATGLRDETLGRGALAGVDARVRIDAATEWRGEVAAGGWHGLASGTAWSSEVERRAGSLDLLAYAREQPIGFGLGQQSLVEAGARRIGVDGRWALSDALTLTASGWHQRTLAEPGERIAGEARLSWRRNARTLFVGAQAASDRGGEGGDERTSRLLTLGGSQALAGGAVDLSGQTQVALGGAAASPAFPVRHQVTAGWRIARGIRLLAGYEIDRGARVTARTAQVGIDLSPWGGATLGGTLNRQAAEAGQRDIAQYRLGQSLAFGPHWSADATLESARTVGGAAPAGIAAAVFQPVAGGLLPGRDGGDATAATLGATFRSPGWTATGRVEWRRASIERRWGISASVLHPLAGGRTLAAGFRTGDAVDAQGRVVSDTTGDVALAWRPLASNWSVLDRLALRRAAGDGGAVALAAPARGLGGDALTLRAVNDLAVQYRSLPDGRGRGMEASVAYGVKYVRGRFADDVAAGIVDRMAADVNRSLGRGVLVGLAGSVEHGWTDRVWAWSGGPALGVSPAGALWLTLGYNVAGYRDRDFAGDRWTRAGPYATLRIKLDPHSVGALLGGRS